jgi:hypothetical protein
LIEMIMIECDLSYSERSCKIDGGLKPVGETSLKLSEIVMVKIYW